MLPAATGHHTPHAPMRLATRESPLAMAQSHMVARMLRQVCPGLTVEFVPIRSHGDAEQTRSLETLGRESGVGVGLFTKALDEALLCGAADIAVHSCKDYPTSIPAGLVAAAYPNRADVRDALVVPLRALAACGIAPGALSTPEVLRQLMQHQPGASIGTGSPRRRAQLEALCPQLATAEVRGNVGTRLRKLLGGQYAALLMAKAGLDRLGCHACPELAHVAVLPFESDELMPAPAQGVLLITCRATDGPTRGLMEWIDSPAARLEATAERACLKAVGGGCFVALGAHAHLDAATATLQVRTVMATHGPAGEVCLHRAHCHGPAGEALQLGTAAGLQLLEATRPGSKGAETGGAAPSTDRALG